MQNLRIKQIDAFTTMPFHGNAAGVVTKAKGLTPREMQHIASEMNVSETAFVFETESEETDVRIRWFTPTQEVKLCGHATIAAFHALCEEGEFGLEVNEAQSFIVETKSGDLNVDVDWKNLLPFIRFSLPRPSFFPYPGEIAALAGALGLSDVELSSKIKPQISDLNYCFVPVKDQSSLASADPDMTLISRLKEMHNIEAVVLVATNLEEDNADWEIRFFAPALGVDEDPVTGSAHGPLAVFLHQNGLLDLKKRAFVFKGLQGRHVGRGGRVEVLMTVNSGGDVEEIQIAGQAVTVLDGTLIMPEKAML